MEAPQKNAADLKAHAERLVTVLKDLVRTLKSHKKYFSAVVAKEVVNALVMDVVKCAQGDVKLYFKPPPPNPHPDPEKHKKLIEEHKKLIGEHKGRIKKHEKPMKETFLLDFDDLQCVNDHYREERNSVCHEARIWAWLYGGEPWVQTLFTEALKKKAPKDVYSEDVAKRLDDFLRSEFAGVLCPKCSTKVTIKYDGNKVCCTNETCKKVIVIKYDTPYLQQMLKETQL